MKLCLPEWTWQYLIISRFYFLHSKVQDVEQANLVPSAPDYSVFKSLTQSVCKQIIVFATVPLVLAVNLFTMDFCCGMTFKNHVWSFLNNKT